MEIQNEETMKGPSGDADRAREEGSIPPYRSEACGRSDRRQARQRAGRATMSTC